MERLVSGNEASFTVASRLSRCIGGVAGSVGGFWCSELHSLRPQVWQACVLCGLLADSCGLAFFCATPFCFGLSCGIAAHAFLTRKQKNVELCRLCSLLKVIQAEPGSMVGALGMRVRFAFSSSAVAMAISVRDCLGRLPRPRRASLRARLLVSGLEPIWLLPDRLGPLVESLVAR